MDVDTLLEDLKAAESRVRALCGAINSIKHDANEIRISLETGNVDMAKRRVDHIERAISRVK